MEFVLWLLAAAVLWMIVTTMWPLALIALAIWLLGKTIDRYQDRAQDRRDERQAIIKRADKQHAQIMAGNIVAGTYGEFLPPPGLR